MKIKLPAETLATLQALGNTLTTANGDQWVYMPKWIKIVGPNTVEIFSFENLPDDVIEAIDSQKSATPPSPELIEKMISTLSPDRHYRGATDKPPQ